MLDFLKADVGDWSVAITAFTPQGPIPNTGVSRNHLVGGRWLVADFATDSGDFEGHGVYGWDPASGWVGTWVDTMRPFLVVMKGSWDEATRTMTYLGEASMGDRVLRWRETTVRVDDDTREIETTILTADGEHTAMRATYRRR